MDKKKFAAAIAAVSAYIKTGEEAAAYQAQQQAQPETAQIQQAASQIIGQGNVWGISGRQSQMQANTMMQMRMFK